MTSSSLLQSFPAVCDANTRVMIFGSLPGVRSLAAAQYYAHPRNLFWDLLGEVIGTPLRSLTYDERLTTVLAHGVGLWDVIAEARRDGSLDSAIRNHMGNDLRTLLASLPKLQTIGFNGGTAAKIGEKALGDLARRYRIVRLPSSSPAYASMPYEAKLAVWQSLRG
ncbi:DNA-deoxyinosine glycosylase [Robbsia sp. KACC 23696]|uniref:DNA-deoxyinosine glycosylase n=1 Tax=Robbsia sp. KACC 23696 TaxID=3149231 RepID=UPI00325BF90A